MFGASLSRCVDQQQHRLRPGLPRLMQALGRTKVNRGLPGQTLRLEDVIKLGSIIRLKKNIVMRQVKTARLRLQAPSERRKAHRCTGCSAEVLRNRIAKQGLSQGTHITVINHLSGRQLLAVGKFKGMKLIVLNMQAAHCGIAAYLNAQGACALGQRLGQGRHAALDRPDALHFNMSNQNQGCRC